MRSPTQYTHQAAADAVRIMDQISLDFRDRSPEPPAILDIPWVLLMRARLDRYQATGVVDWMGVKP